jgi:FkbM family methyltransferase
MTMPPSGNTADPAATSSQSAPPVPFGTYAPHRLARTLLRATAQLPDSWTGRRLASALRRLILPPLAGQVDWQAFGLEPRLQPKGNICEKRALFTPQYFDPAERALIAAWEGPRESFVDLGANVGLYALIAATLDPPFKRVLAIEPQGEIFARLQVNIALNGLAQVRALRLAVSDQAGEAELVIDPINRGESRLASEGNDAGAAASRIERVPCRTLIEILDAEGIVCPEVLKLDVEGMEERILSQHFSASGPERWPRLILLEHAPQRWAGDCLGLCEDRGYRQARRTRMNVVLIRD